MNIKKPTPRVVEQSGNLCPVCGKRSYSRDGIHPQCAQLQAEAPRNEENRAKRQAEKEAPTKKEVRRSWDKQCPRCGAKFHVRKKACECGHNFFGQAK